MNLLLKFSPKWRRQTTLEESCPHGIVVDAKLYVVVYQRTLVYDVPSDTWTEQIPLLYDDVMHAFAHDGRIVVCKRGMAFHRGTGSDPADMIWSQFDLNLGLEGFRELAGGSVLLG